MGSYIYTKLLLEQMCTQPAKVAYSHWRPKPL